MFRLTEMLLRLFAMVIRSLGLSLSPPTRCFDLPKWCFVNLGWCLGHWNAVQVSGVVLRPTEMAFCQFEMIFRSLILFRSAGWC